MSGESESVSVSVSVLVSASWNASLTVHAMGALQLAVTATMASVAGCSATVMMTFRVIL